MKAAKIIFADSVIDCVVRDRSATGIRVGTEAVVPFPSQVTIELRSGGVWLAATRWQQGLETGFEIVRFMGLHNEAMSEAEALYQQLRGCGLVDVLERLADVRFFDHDEIKAAADCAAAAVTTLEQVLKLAAGRT